MSSKQQQETTVNNNTSDLLALDLENFSLSPYIEEIFTNVAGLLLCKKKADNLYLDSVQSNDKLLEDPEFQSFGAPPEQAFNTVEGVITDARQKKPEFDNLLQMIVEEKGLDPNQEVMVNGEPIVKDFGSYKILTLTDLKNEKRCHTKIKNKYDGNARFLSDVGRATIVCSTEEELVNVIRALRKRKEEVDIVRIKNRVTNPLFTGGRHILMNVKVNNHVFEIQLHQADLLFYYTNADGHKYYEFFLEHFVGTSAYYQKRTEIFDRIGEAVLGSNITIAIKMILEGTDEKKLEALKEITALNIFATHDINLMANKRLQALMKIGDVKWYNGLKNIALAYDNQGKYDEAMELYQQALEGQLSAMGDNHPSTLVTIGSMAIVYVNQGKYDKALELDQKALEGQLLALGEAHPSTLETIGHMAIVYCRQGKYDKALELDQKALEGQLSALGDNHPSTLVTMGNMATLYTELGKYDKALELYQKALEGQSSAMGDNHPSTLFTMSNMADLYTELGKYDKALELYQKALEGQSSAMGDNHPSTLFTMSNMAALYSEQEKYDKALELFQQALEGQLSALGDNHPSTLFTMSNMAVVYFSQGKYDQALELFQQALEGKLLALGDNHPSTLVTMSNIASVYFRQGNYDKALELFQPSLEGLLSVLGEAHPSTLNTKAWISQVNGKREGWIHGLMKCWSSHKSHRWE